MTISKVDRASPLVTRVKVTGEVLLVEFSDGRSVSVPISWYPRLTHATQAERGNWRLIGRGQGIHWEELDEDISVESILAGRQSGETQASFKRWAAGRAKHRS